MSRGKEIVVILACAVLFSLFTVYVQSTTLGLKYLEGRQLERHAAVIEGKSGDPWQYRVLSEYLVEGALLVTRSFSLAHATAVAFIVVRLLQNVLLFIFASLYYRQLGLNLYVTVFGLTLLAYSMIHSLYDSDLAFNSYFDVMFYLVAGWLILRAKYSWLVPVTLLAALNRETSGLIPMMLIAHDLHLRPKLHVSRQAIWLGVISLATYASALIGLRLVYGPRELLWPYGHRWGIDLLWFNLSQYATWPSLFGVMGPMPVLAMVAWPKWPDALRRFGAAIVPVWLLVHLFLSTAQWAESRIFLVPQVTVFIPGALLGLVQGRQTEDS